MRLDVGAADGDCRILVLVFPDDVRRHCFDVVEIEQALTNKGPQEMEGEDVGQRCAASVQSAAALTFHR